MTERPELVFDGCGINGPDEYRTRIATFAKIRGPEAQKYGPMFAAAPDMLAALEALLKDKYLSQSFNSDRMDPVRAAIAKARGFGHE